MEPAAGMRFDIETLQIVRCNFLRRIILMFYPFEALDVIASVDIPKYFGFEYTHRIFFAKVRNFIDIAC